MKNNMRVILAKKRLKVADVARETGLSKSTLTALYYERTKRPDIETLLKIANYLGVSIDELLTPEDWRKAGKQWRGTIQGSSMKCEPLTGWTW